MRESKEIIGLDYDIENWRNITKGEEGLGYGTVQMYMCAEYQSKPEDGQDVSSSCCANCPLFRTGHGCFEPNSVHNKYSNLVAITDKSYDDHCDECDNWIGNGESIHNEIEAKHGVDIILAAKEMLQILKALRSYQRWSNLF